MKNELWIVLLLFSGFVGCSSSVQTDRPYQEIGRAQHFTLVEPGYVIGIEKIKINNEILGKVPNKKKPYSEYFIENSDEKNKQRNDEFKSATSGGSKVMMVTQITKSVKFCGNFYNHYLYNSYSNFFYPKYDLDESFSQIDAMFNDLKNQLKDTKEPFTHILIMSMGWNNDQAESMWRYNTILNNLNLASSNNSSFKPLVIVFTWPSVWGSVSDSIILKTFRHLVSYGNKASDADEIGYTWANWIVNHQLPAAIEAAHLKDNPKVVLIGHSFGARLLSRALFSSSYIKSTYSRSNPVDIFLGLQGAFSARRFVADAGLEGNPYSEFNKFPTKFILTTSSHDWSNAAAFWSAHMGGPWGLNYAQKHTNVFNIKDWSKGSSLSDLSSTEEILLINASSIVNGDHNDDPNAIDAHNDILDHEMGELIWSAIH